MTFDEWYRSIYPKTVEADVFELLKDVWAKASLGAYEDCAVFVDTKEAYSVDRDYLGDAIRKRGLKRGQA